MNIYSYLSFNDNSGGDRGVEELHNSHPHHHSNMDDGWVLQLWTLISEGQGFDSTH